MNAVACPTGMIFVSTGLLDVLESESELEAILAHEITHCERRHGYQEFRSAIAHELATQALAALILGAVTYAGESDDNIALAGKLSLAIGRIASRIALVGHVLKNEEEADAYATLYLSSAGLSDGTEGLRRIMSKMQYATTSGGALPSEASALSTHPDIDTRLLRARSTRLALYPAGTAFVGLDSRGEPLCTLTLHAWSVAPTPQPQHALVSRDRSIPTPLTTYDVRIYASLETLPDMPKAGTVNDAVLECSGGQISLDNYEDTSIQPDGIFSLGLWARLPRPVEPTMPTSLSMGVPGVARWVPRQPE